VSQTPPLERAAIVLAAVVLAIAVIALASGVFAGADSATVSTQSAAGLHFADQGDARLAPGLPHPPYDSTPPTSGPHRFATITGDGTRLRDDQILTAIAAGNVIVFYGTTRPPAALVRLAGPFTPALARTGLAVIFAPRRGVHGLVAIAWTRMLRAASASDPLLSQFIRSRLGIPGR